MINLIMLELPHAAVGATIAVLIPNPLLAVPLAFASHFVMDLFPHWNPHIGREIRRYGHIAPSTTLLLVFDSSLSLYLGFALAFRVLPHITESFNILACSFAAVLPDVIEIPLILFHRKWVWLRRFSKWESSHQSRLPAPTGIFTQLFILFACTLLILTHI